MATIAEIQAIAPADMKVGETGEKAYKEHRGGGEKKFIEGDAKTLIYWIAYKACGLCRNCWAIDMWAAHYKEISLEKFYLFLEETLKRLQLLSNDERQKIWSDSKTEEAFGTLLYNGLEGFK